jgi:hypothetical protein
VWRVESPGAGEHSFAVGREEAEVVAFCKLVIDLVSELVRTGRAWGSGALSPRDRLMVGSVTTGLPEGP